MNPGFPFQDLRGPWHSSEGLQYTVNLGELPSLGKRKDQTLSQRVVKRPLRQTEVDHSPEVGTTPSASGSTSLVPPEVSYLHPGSGTVCRLGGEWGLHRDERWPSTSTETLGLRPTVHGRTGEGPEV